VACLTPEREQRLLELACELINRVREVDPERNGTWLESIRPDWRDLLVVLAAMVDPEAPMSTTLGWTFGLVPVYDA
jgi:hypothetical protein